MTESPDDLHWIQVNSRRSVSLGRRRLMKSLCALTVPGALQTIAAKAATAESSEWHHAIAEKARSLATGRSLRLMVPKGSEANVLPVTERFTQLSGVRCELAVVNVDDINTELILMSETRDARIDIALPATFGLADLTERGVLHNLDEFALRHEPAGFRDDYFFTQGDFLNKSLYGYQTDGDAYLMFYNRSMLQNPANAQRYKEEFGESLAPAETWVQLDQQMRFFHKPGQTQFGGSLFRNPTYSVWEWWVRFHATGQFPVADDMTPLIDSDEGVEALNSLMAASASLTESAKSNSLFENWQEFAQGNSYCNLGWGGTQKFLRSQPGSENQWIAAPLPGGIVDGKLLRFGYMNWGWDYAVTSFSSQSELAYLFCLFATSPAMSTLAIRQKAGFFDPFRASHHEDKDIRATYTDAFLSVQKISLEESIPDFYLPGQGEYFNALRTSILDAQNGLVDASEALHTAAGRWRHITRRYGVKQQTARWKELKASYPSSFRE